MDVTGITAEKAEEIEGNSVVSGAINEMTGHLILTKGSGATIDAGNVVPDIPDATELAANGDYSSGKVIEASDQRNVRPGMTVIWLSDTIPAGWVALRGQEVNRIGTYAALFAAWGTEFGVGNGTTTFNLPNFASRMPYGAAGNGEMGDTGGSATKPVPVHTHSTPNHTHTDTFDVGAPDGGLVNRGPSDGGADNTVGTAHTHTLSGSVSSSGAGTSGAAAGSAFDVLNPFLRVNFIAKL